MKAKSNFNNQSGTILIVTLWILAILTVFALALGRQASLELKLAEYQRDRLKAEGLARAAIERAILEKQSDYVWEVDALSETWANNVAAFKEVKLGEGSFNVSFSGDGQTLYGAEDEESKINVNKAREEVLVNLLASCGVAEPERLASSILIWCGRKQDMYDEEEMYYQSLELPYHCKKEELKSLAELLLVRGMTPEILYGTPGNGAFSEKEAAGKYLTVYGRGQININTASEKALSALFEDEFPNLGAKVIGYRRGFDGKTATEDDQWFSLGRNSVTLETGEIKQLKDLASDDALDDPFETEEWERLRELASASPPELSVRSNTYTISAQAEVRRVKKSIITTIDFSQPAKITYLFWQEN